MNAKRLARRAAVLVVLAATVAAAAWMALDFVDFMDARQAECQERADFHAGLADDAYRRGDAEAAAAHETAMVAWADVSNSAVRCQAALDAMQHGATSAPSDETTQEQEPHGR